MLAKTNSKRPGISHHHLMTRHRAKITKNTTPNRPHSYKHPSVQRPAPQPPRPATRRSLLTPRSIEAQSSDYVFVYDPSEVYFDSFSVNYTRRDGKRNSGPQTSKGGAFPEDAAKRMISLPKAAKAPVRYNQPSSSRAKNFVSGITVQFFYTRGERTDEQHESMLAQFQALATKGQFLVRRGGAYEPVARSQRRP